MRPLADQRLQIGGRHPQFARDPAEVDGIHLTHFPELAPVLEPVAEDVDHAADDGIGRFLNGHGRAALVAGMARGERRSSANRCAGSKRECVGDNLPFNAASLVITITPQDYRAPFDLWSSDGPNTTPNPRKAAAQAPAARCRSALLREGSIAAQIRASAATTTAA